MLFSVTFFIFNELYCMMRKKKSWLARYFGEKWPILFGTFLFSFSIWYVYRDGFSLLSSFGFAFSAGLFILEQRTRLMEMKRKFFG